MSDHPRRLPSGQTAIPLLAAAAALTLFLTGCDQHSADNTLNGVAADTNAAVDKLANRVAEKTENAVDQAADKVSVAAAEATDKAKAALADAKPKARALADKTVTGLD